MNEHEKIDYVEFPAKDIEAAKAFFSTMFGWDFVDPNGNEYAVWSDTVQRSAQTRLHTFNKSDMK